MSKYKALGVDVRKEGVQSFRDAIDNLYPGAFCVVTRDPTNPNTGLISHTDSAGSKPIVSYLCYKESGDPSWFKGLAQDAVAMNIDDIVCVAAKPLVFIDYIAFNTILIDRVSMLSAISNGFSKTLSMLSDQKLPVLFGGGETADLPDQIRTLDVSGAIFGIVHLNKVVTGYDVTPEDLIVGLRSGGHVRYEDSPNSGIMCNGLTLARNCLLRREYLEEYPELAQPGKERFTGRFNWDDSPDGLGMTVAEALISPTRIFAPIATRVVDKLGDAVHGMIHNTGGGLTKCLGLGREIGYVMDCLPEPDPIFKLIQAEAEVDWREMYEDFNMGIGFEFIVDPERALDVIEIANEYDIEAQIVGHCEKNSGKNKLKIESHFGKYTYSLDE